MTSRRLFLIPHPRQLPLTVFKRYKQNQWGTYGYSNFGHDQPDHFPPITKFFHFFVVSGILVSVIDWDRYWPKIESRYQKTKKFISTLVGIEGEDPSGNSKQITDTDKRKKT